MRKRSHIIILILILVYMGLSILSLTAMATEKPSVEFSASISLSGELPDLPHKYSIQLIAEDIGNPMPEGSLNGGLTLDVTGESTLTFPEIIFPSVGKYSYVVSQIDGSDPDCIYDDTVYHIKVTVVNITGSGLEISSVVNKENETAKSSQIEFKNHYSVSTGVVFQAVKTLDGKTPEVDQFKFLLLDENETVLQTKSNKGNSVVFDEILFREIGTHIFYIKESIGTIRTISYDPTVYKATVTITKNEQGDYVSVISYLKDQSPFADVPVFKNKTLQNEFPKTGELNSNLPLIGVILILTGVLMATNRKKRID